MKLLSSVHEGKWAKYLIKNIDMKIQNCVNHHLHWTEAALYKRKLWNYWALYTNAREQNI